jgi:hypothetical protein
MKWVFCLNDAGAKSYPFKLAQVAIHTAKKYTDLEPVCLFDGEDENFINYLKSKNVEIIQTESPIKEKIQYLIKNSFVLDHVKDKQALLDFAGGAFLRFEIHKHIEDPYCLYTDYDVFFTKNFELPEKNRSTMEMCFETPNSNIQPHYFFTDLKRDYNTGVIWFNLHSFKNMYNDFIAKCLETVYMWSQEEHDQSAVNWYCHNQVDLLDSNYNWRPQHGVNENAKIIHFQRIKPFKEGFDIYYNYTKNLKSYVHYEKLFFKYFEEIKDD